MSEAEGMTTTTCKRPSRITMVTVAWSLFAVGACTSPKMSSRVDPEAIRSIEMGMTERQMVNILGQPLRVRPWGDSAVIYDYASPGWASGQSLWVYMEKGAVRTVQGKRRRLIAGDEAVYEARPDRPTFESSEFSRVFARGH